MLQTETILFMLLILGFTWGGLIYFVNRAYRREKEKK
ncbi:MAG: MetS family NSS transporter small subunit [Calditrichaeota bacterium]|nr:MAG: MetS family NSS transporter small subunit [Calditrichota bacterium]